MEADDAPVGGDGGIQTHRHTDAVFVATRADRSTTAAVASGPEFPWAPRSFLDPGTLKPPLGSPAGDSATVGLSSDFQPLADFLHAASGDLKRAKTAGSRQGLFRSAPDYSGTSTFFLPPPRCLISARKRHPLFVSQVKQPPHR